MYLGKLALLLDQGGLRAVNVYLSITFLKNIGEINMHEIKGIYEKYFYTS